MLLAWKAQGIMTLAGYILGFPGDTPESIRRDIAIMQRELPLDIVEFFMLTPLPGSEDHKVLWSKGVDMDHDLNKYDLEHVVTDHPKMSREELQSVYRDAWSQYYSDEHIETLIKRAAATGVPLISIAKLVVQFATMMPIHNLHPLQSGILRMKHPSERRPGLPREHAIIFYPRHLWEQAVGNVRFARAVWRTFAVKRRIENDPDRQAYMDVALTPVGDDEDETFDYLTKTTGAKAAIDHLKKVAALTHST